MYDLTHSNPALLSTLEQTHARDHLCMIYETQQEQFAAVVPFIRMGLERGEQCLYITDENAASEVMSAMSAGGINVDAAVESGALTLADKRETYLKQGYFDSDWMIAFLRQALEASKAAGYRALRITGEMTWALGEETNCEQLIDYEAKLNHFFPHHDSLAICQYNRQRFNSEIILNVIRTHPLVIHGDVVCKNHYYVPPDEFLSPNQHSREVDRLLASILDRERYELALRESEAHEREARKAAEAANRLKDEFLATLSHELRTPLTAIIGWTHLLRSGQIGPDSSSHAMEIIERNARAQKQLIEDLLDVSRVITGKLRLDARPVELTSVIEAAVESVRPAAEAKGLRLQVMLDAKAGPVSGDPDRLQQVAWNLLSNAVKFTPAGGRVEVRLQRSDAHIEIVVRDTGIGIAPESLPFVFDRFWQADGSYTRAHGGLGLGLATARHLVELHGGTIQAASAGEGQGATFTVKLPLISHSGQNLVASAHPTATPTTSPDLGPRLYGLHVLVVDDEPDTVELLALMLNGHGATVTTAVSAGEALAALGRVKPDVLVCDIGMPGEDGYSLIGRVRMLPAEQGGAIPAVALTAYAREEDRRRALRAGFQIHVPKPTGPAELMAVVASLAGKIGKL